MNARRIAVAVAAVLVLVGGVVAAVLLSGDEAEEAAEETTTTTEAEEPPPPPPVLPLTGLPVGDPVIAGRPALMVKVDSAPKALGRQAGLNAADVVYVEMVEGGVTRLAAVYHSVDAEVGPVRSARSTDVTLAANLNRPLFAFSGANQGVLDQVRGANLVDLGYDAHPGLYQSRGSGVLRFFVATPAFFGAAPPDSGPPPQHFTFRAQGEGVTAAGAEPSNGVAIAYPGQANTQVRYDPVPEGWARSQHGAPQAEASGARITATNVIVQFTDYREAGFRDVTGSPSPEAVLVGEGEAWVLTGGTLVRGRWSRPDPAAVTSFTDGAGQPIALTPGRTWIELAPPGTATPL
ncbi:MAG: DUF3048 domain-containing protein [Actinobacteria bacterium]|nr:DUF3048 domain-containing protein [Actinomycetota bacterium]